MPANQTIPSFKTLGDSPFFLFFFSKENTLITFVSLNEKEREKRVFRRNWQKFERSYIDSSYVNVKQTVFNENLDAISPKEMLSL